MSDGTTALGGDNRTGCALLVTLVETLLKNDLPHPPITLLFKVREESGLHGARELDPANLSGAFICSNVDGRLAPELITGAVRQENWEVAITGKASHAGVAPEKGISGTMVGAIGLAEAKTAGWFGKIVKPDGHGADGPDGAGELAARPGRPILSRDAPLFAAGRDPHGRLAATAGHGALIPQPPPARPGEAHDRNATPEPEGYRTWPTL